MTSPAPLPRRARALLDAYREAHAIPADVEARVWSVVGADQAPDAEPWPEPPARRRTRRAPPASRRPRWLGLGVALLAAAAVLALAWQLGGALASRRQAARSPDAAVMQPEAPARRGRAGAPVPAPAQPGASEPAATPSPAPAPEALTTGPIDPVDGSVRSRRSDRALAPGAPASSPDDPPREAPAGPASTLADERDLVARAWRALALGDTAAALDAAAEHARRFPAGLLAPEREATQTIARCRRGDADGPERAAAFHRTHPRSPLRERVGEACRAAAANSSAPP
jgi:hypothetical protein